MFRRQQPSPPTELLIAQNKLAEVEKQKTTGLMDAENADYRIQKLKEAMMIHDKCMQWFQSTTKAQRKGQHCHRSHKNLLQALTKVDKPRATSAEKLATRISNAKVTLESLHALQADGQPVLVQEIKAGIKKLKNGIVTNKIPEANIPQVLSKIDELESGVSRQPYCYLWATASSLSESYRRFSECAHDIKKSHNDMKDTLRKFNI